MEPDNYSQRRIEGPVEDVDVSQQDLETDEHRLIVRQAIGTSELADLIGRHKSTVNRAVKRLGIEGQYVTPPGGGRALMLTPQEATQVAEELGAEPVDKSSVLENDTLHPATERASASLTHDVALSDAQGAIVGADTLASVVDAHQALVDHLEDELRQRSEDLATARADVQAGLERERKQADALTQQARELGEKDAQIAAMARAWRWFAQMLDQLGPMSRLRKRWPQVPDEISDATAHDTER